MLPRLDKQSYNHVSDYQTNRELLLLLHHLGGRASLRISPAGAVSLAQCAAMFMALQAYLHSGASWPETGHPESTAGMPLW